MILNHYNFISKLSLDVSLIGAKTTKEELHNAKKLLTQLSENQNYCTIASDCVILPTGTRPCGGPSDYIVYSNLVSPLCPTVLVPIGMCNNHVCKQDKRTTVLYAVMYPIGRS